MQYTVLLATLAVGCLSYSLPRSQEHEKTVTKRQANWPWFVPAIFIPQIVEVHHVVYLQRPDIRCFPDFPRPTSGPVTNTTETPVIDNRFGETNTTSKEPSRCVWAIVACCAPGSRNIRYSCFELLGCQGAFWDVSPCENNVVSAAANTALNFYMSNNNETQQNEIPTVLNN